MADPIRNFESEVIAPPGLKRVAAKKEAGKDLGVSARKPRRKRGREEAQIKLLLLRLIEHFEAGPSDSGAL